MAGWYQGWPILSKEFVSKLSLSMNLPYWTDAMLCVLCYIMYVMLLVAVRKCENARLWNESVSHTSARYLSIANTKWYMNDVS